MIISFPLMLWSLNGIPEYNRPPPPQQPLQYSSRASTRIVARATGTPSLESQYPISDYDDAMMYQDSSSSSSRKRSISHDDEEFGGPPKPKRAKKQHLQRSFGPKGRECFQFSYVPPHFYLDRRTLEKREEAWRIGPDSE